MSILVQELTSATLPTQFGVFDIRLFTDGRDQAIVLSKGDLRGQRKVFLRIHSDCLLSHAFFTTNCDCRGQLGGALEKIQSLGKGLVVYMLSHVGRGAGLAAQISMLPLKDAGKSNGTALKNLGFKADERDYSLAAKVLRSLDVKAVHLMGGNQEKRQTLEQFGIEVEKIEEYEERVRYLGSTAKNLVDDIVEKGNEPPFPSNGQPRALIIGPLRYDEIDDDKERTPLFYPNDFLQPLRDANIAPLLVGQIGSGVSGDKILENIRNSATQALIGKQLDRQCRSRSWFANSEPPWAWRDAFPLDESTTCIDVSHLDQALVLSAASHMDVVVLSGDILAESEPEVLAEIVEIINNRNLTCLSTLPRKAGVWPSVSDLSSPVPDGIEAVMIDTNVPMKGPDVPEIFRPMLTPERLCFFRSWAKASIDLTLVKKSTQGNRDSFSFMELDKVERPEGPGEYFKDMFRAISTAVAKMLED